jgi:ParB family chromosome partitioning protein
VSSKKDTPYPQLKKPIDLLFGGETSEPLPEEQSSTNELAIAQIKLPPNQVRRYFDPQKLEELSRSIQEVGILEPLLVRPSREGDYELIAGERRLRAAQMAGLEKVPVIVRQMSDVAVKQVRLIENLQREDLNPWEETEGIVELLSVRLSLKHDEVPRLLYRLHNEQKKINSSNKATDLELTHNVMGKEDEEEESDSTLKIVQETFAALGRMSWESFVKNRLPLLNLPEKILAALSRGQIEYTKAKLIARVKDEQAQKELLDLAIAQNLSLSEIQEQINAIAAKKSDSPAPSLKSEYKELSKQLGTSKVWDNPKKQKSLEKLLAQIKALLSE